MWVSPAAAQTFEVVGTRAAGMGGAFVAVADDASATYWNPAGLALGNVFSAVIDRKADRVEEKTAADPSSRGTGLLLTVGMPVLGFTYYQLQSSSATPLDLTAAPVGNSRQPGSGLVQLDRLVTHHTGVTLVQSLFRGVSVGTTLKAVHGTVSTVVVSDSDRKALLDRADDLPGEGETKFDADLGVMAGSGKVKLGLTVRNLTEPSFAQSGPSSDSLRLRRQFRGGVAVSFIDGWAAASDFDFTENGPATDPVRSLAFGVEGHVIPKAFVRSGFRLSTTGKARPSIAGGGSYKVWSALLIDGQATWGGENADRSWGVAARFVY
jgi:hypothetical protein